MTRKETFEWLDRYRLAKKAETEIEQEIEMLENEYMIPAKRMDGMPRGSGGKDLASFAAQFDKLHRKLLRQKAKRIRIQEEITQAIETAPITDRERAMLRYHYILFFKWEDSFEAVGVERSWGYRLRNKAIKSLDIKSDFKRQEKLQ